MSKARAHSRPGLLPGLLSVGLLLAAMFVVGGLIIREIPVLAQFTNDVLGYAKAGSLWLVAVVTFVNGVAEELFFRGALFAAIGVRHPVLISTVLYALATIAGGNLVLVFAAAVLGLVTGLQGTGDTLRNAQFTEQSLQSLLDRLGIVEQPVSEG